MNKKLIILGVVLAILIVIGSAILAVIVFNKNNSKVEVSKMKSNDIICLDFALSHKINYMI